MLPVVVRGSFRDVSGYSSFTRLVVRALHEAGCDPFVASFGSGAFSQYIPSDEYERRLLDELAEKPLPDLSLAVVISVSPASYFNRCYGRSIGYSMIEATRISPEWTECCNLSDQTWVPGPFCKKSFEESGVLNAIVMAPGFDTETYRPKTSDRYGIWDALKLPFYFIMNGHLFESIEDRKGIKQLVRCFVREFHGDPDVGLALKTQVLDHSFVDKIQLLNAITGILAVEGHPEDIGRIEIIHRNQTSDELATLYNHPAIKAFVSPTAGEGYGLNMLEAASCGLHVIATGWSEHVTYLPRSHFIPLPCELAELPEEFTDKKTKVYVKGSKWAKVGDEDLMEAMRRFYDENRSKPKDGTAPDFSAMSLVAFGERMKFEIERSEITQRVITVPENIQVASGIYPEEGYFHVDLDPVNSAQVDLLWDANELPFPEGSVQRILASHIIEHLRDDEAAKLVYNLWRILADGGELEIRVPDADVAFDMWDEWMGDPPPPVIDRIRKMIHGSKDPHVNLWGYTKLERFLKRMGFSDIRRVVGEIMKKDAYDEISEAGIGKGKTVSLKVVGTKRRGMIRA